MPHEVTPRDELIEAAATLRQSARLELYINSDSTPVRLSLETLAFLIQDSIDDEGYVDLDALAIAQRINDHKHREAAK